MSDAQLTLATRPGDLSPSEWKDLITGYSRLGRVLHDEHGVEPVFHPHPDTDELAMPPLLDALARLNTDLFPPISPRSRLAGCTNQKEELDGE